MTSGLLASIVLVFILTGLSAKNGNFDETWSLVRFGGNFPLATFHGEPWRLITSMFLHAGPLHLLVNCYSLYQLGQLIETMCGPHLMLLIYFIAGLSGALTSAFFGLDYRLSVGASGAIFGLMGTAVVMFLVRLRNLMPKEENKRILINLVGIIAINLYIGFTQPMIDNAAHIGGLVGGALASLILTSPRVLRRPQAASIFRNTSLACIAMSLICVFIAIRLPLSYTLSHLPKKTVARAGVQTICPRHWVLLDEPGLVIQDPLLSISPTLQFEALGLAHASSEEFAALSEQSTEAILQGLGEQKNISDVRLLAPSSVATASLPDDIRATEIGLKLQGQEMRQMQFFRRQSESVLMTVIRMPAARVPDYSLVLKDLIAQTKLAN